MVCGTCGEFMKLLTVIKYWYDPSWPELHTLDLTLAEFSLDIPFRVEWSAGKEIVEVHVTANPLYQRMQISGRHCQTVITRNNIWSRESKPHHPSN
jgi:hypothetical protein